MKTATGKRGGHEHAAKRKRNSKGNGEYQYRSRQKAKPNDIQRHPLKDASGVPLTNLRLAENDIRCIA